MVDNEPAAAGVATVVVDGWVEEAGGCWSSVSDSSSLELSSLCTYVCVCVCVCRIHSTGNLQ